MKHALALVLAVMAALVGLDLLFGYALTFKLAYGAIAYMGVLIAMTFLWLYKTRATPLALGMVFSWAGAALVMGWWWSYQLLDEPEWMRANPLHFAALSLYIAGAIMHFVVIQRSIRLPRMLHMLPVAAALCLFGLTVLAR